MSVEFVDTNILVYTHDLGSVAKRHISIELVDQLNAENEGATSTQVLAELYSVATPKSSVALRSTGGTPCVNSALELGCTTLWTEDLANGQRFSTLTARNPFA